MKSQKLLDEMLFLLRGYAMKLAEFSRTGRGKNTRFVLPIIDAAGGEGHQLSIAGPAKLVQSVLGESDFEVKITPGGSKEGWELEQQRFFEDKPHGSLSGLPLERIEDLRKPETNEVALDHSLFIDLQKTRPGGTSYAINVPLFVPAGVSLFFWLPPVCSCFGVLMPITGDPDLRLAINRIGPPFVAASLLPGTAWDSVSFSAVCLPWMHFVPFYQIDGFVTGGCTFFCSGFGLP